MVHGVVHMRTYEKLTGRFFQIVLFVLLHTK